VLSAHPVNAAGHLATALPAACHYRNWGPACLASHGIKVALTYQPASRFWAFQWYECGIFLALALSLAGVLLLVATPSGGLKGGRPPGQQAHRVALTTVADTAYWD